MAAFAWSVATDGYRWTSEKGIPLQADGIKPEVDSEDWPDCHLEPVRQVFREYEPFKDTGLFRVFADIPQTPAAMLVFANQYGHLGDEKTEFSEPLDVPEFESPVEEEEWWRDTIRLVRLFDPIHLWVREIAEMRRCVGIWEHAQRGEDSESAIAKALETVNRKLTGDRFHVAFSKDRKPGGFAMQIVPSNLLAALWLQFGQAITENKKLRSCAACTKWFELTPPMNRKSKLYCSEACKSRAYRTRIEQALRMSAAGKDKREIADVLDSTVATVGRWLKNAK